MTLRSIFGKIRRKIIKILLGSELFDNLVNLNQINKSIAYLNDSITINFEKIEQAIFRIENDNKFIDSKCENISKIIKKTIPHSYIDFLEIHLTEHCNLNCWGCSHFSSLADKEFLSLSIFEKDMKRLYELSSGNIGRINLMGGEPLLHPDLINFFEISRKYFKYTVIRLVTNGLLLGNMDDQFWNAVKINNIHITPTKYPINLPWDDIEKTASQYGVKMYYFSDSDKYVKTMKCIALDIEGKQNQFDGFLFCHEGNNCIHLRNSRLYTCPIAAYAEHFNKYFNQNLNISDADGIDIYKASEMREILEFLARPIPFCRYCDVSRITGHIWQTSKKEISEWTGI